MRNGSGSALVVLSFEKKNVSILDGKFEVEIVKKCGKTFAIIFPAMIDFAVVRAPLFVW